MLPFVAFDRPRLPFTALVCLSLPFAALSAFGQSNPVPFVNQPLVPSAVAPGGPDFTLTVNGTGFVSGATVNWNGTPLATTFISSSQLTATVPAANFASPGTAAITVVNPNLPPLVGRSNAVFFSVTSSTSAAFANAPGSPINVGTVPLSLAMGDFNGDARLDLAVLNNCGEVSFPSCTATTSSTITILLGNGDGTFTESPTPLTVGVGAIALVARDFNGDGKLDLAVLNACGNAGSCASMSEASIMILLGNGDGTFTQLPSTPSVGYDPSALAVGDFNRDGRLDLAVADLCGPAPCTNSSNGTVVVLPGNGDGTFAQTASSPLTEAGPTSIAVGDFNGDGKLDMAVADDCGTGAWPNTTTCAPNGTVTILLGNGDGTFAASAATPATGPLAVSIVAADFNHDGKLDLAVANECGDTMCNDPVGSVTLLLGNGDGTFTPASSSSRTGSHGDSIAVADLNGDVNLDLVVGGGSATILLGNGDGTFNPTALPPSTDAGPVSWGIADFDGDGTLDLASADSNSHTVLVNLQARPPALVSVVPNSGGGSSGIFQFTFSDSAGFSDLHDVGMMFNTGLGSNSTCLVIYNALNNSLYLASDAGAASYLGPLALGSVGTLANSQCTVGGAGMAVSGSGNNLTVTLPVTFSATYVGAKTIYMVADDAEHLHTGWSAMGTWTIPSSPPVLVGVTPSSGSGASQVFQFAVSDPNGTKNLHDVSMMFNTGLGSNGACLVNYYAPLNSLYLASDAGATSGYLGPVAVGSGGTLSNSQCTVGGAGTAVSGSGNSFTVTLPVTFSTTFVGAKTTYMVANNLEGQRTGWSAMGTWTIPSSPPVLVGVTPSSGSGTSQVFQFAVSDPNGTKNLRDVSMMFNTSLTSAHTCLVEYYAPNNSLYLASDAGATSGYLGPVAVGSGGTLSNSQCTVGGPGTAVSGSGTNFTVTLPVTFSGAYTGAKNIYLVADNLEKQRTGWQAVGTWTIP